jgi:glycosyltransferase involved in cell wall biosynthesis
MTGPVIGIDYRPALIGASGIGRYTRELVRALPEFCGDLDLRLFAVFRKDVGERIAPAGCEDFRLVSGRMPGRLLNWLGALGLASVESFTGPLDLFQSTDFVRLPLRTARRIATIHDLSFLREPGWYEPASRARIEKVTRRLVAESRFVMTDSEASRRDLVEFLGVAEDRIAVAPLGADDRFFALPEAPAGPPRILCCGTLEPRKNQLRLIAAFDRLRQVEPEARLTIVGRRGWLDDEIVAELERRTELGVTWLREADDELLLAAMAAANIVAYPSLWEGFGLPLLEGLAAGRAVLSSARGSMAEVAGDAALLVDPESVEAIAEGLIALARHEKLRRDLGARARVRARSFSWRRCAEATVAVWRRLLEEEA